MDGTHGSDGVLNQEAKAVNVETASAIRKRNLVIGIAVLVAVALAAVGLYFAEVKWGLVSASVAWALTNPFVAGAVLTSIILGGIALAIYLYRRTAHGGASQSRANHGHGCQCHLTINSGNPVRDQDELDLRHCTNIIPAPRPLYGGHLALPELTLSVTHFRYGRIKEWYDSREPNARDRDPWYRGKLIEAEVNLSREEEAIVARTQNDEDRRNAILARYPFDRTQFLSRQN